MAGLQLARGMGLKNIRQHHHRQLDTVDSSDSEDENGEGGDGRHPAVTLTDAEIPATMPESRQITSARYHSLQLGGLLACFRIAPSNCLTSTLTPGSDSGADCRGKMPWVLVQRSK